MNLDFEALTHLLHIEEKTRHHPKLKPIHDRVTQELEKLATDLKAPDSKPAEPTAAEPEPAKETIFPRLPEKKDE